MTVKYCRCNYSDGVVRTGLEIHDIILVVSDPTEHISRSLVLSLSKTKRVREKLFLTSVTSSCLYSFEIAILCGFDFSDLIICNIRPHFFFIFSKI